MRYYQFHIGDYASHTAGLSLLEDLAYRRLIGQCYLHEAPLTGTPAEIARDIGMRDQAEEVEFVLGKFFTLRDLGWSQTRITDDLAAFQSKQAKASAAGHASAAVRLSKPVIVPAPDSQRTFNASSTDVQRTFTERATSVKKPTPQELFPEVSEEVLTAFIEQRRFQKAPITALVVGGIRREAEKAGLSLEAVLLMICERSWKSFKAEYVNKNEIKVDRQFEGLT